MHINIEIKAKCEDHNRIRDILRQYSAREVGTDHQIDTYFRCENGRLKLREGNIENTLIHYDRTDQAGPKRSDVTLYEVSPGSKLHGLLTKALGVKVVVDKKREIYFIGNVKFHLDTVEGLGKFVEIEAIDKTGTIGVERLRAQCDQYMALFGIEQDNLLTSSYSDMLLARRK
jgi:predicted adenylyl cyclase CyaB